MKEREIIDNILLRNFKVEPKSEDIKKENDSINKNIENFILNFMEDYYDCIRNNNYNIHLVENAYIYEQFKKLKAKYFLSTLFSDCKLDNDFNEYIRVYAIPCNDLEYKGQLLENAMHTIIEDIFRLNVYYEFLIKSLKE